MAGNNMTHNLRLDNEEKALLESIEQEQWQSVYNRNKEIAEAKVAANKYLTKDTRVNIRISSSDLSMLKRKAAYKGLPYQTLIASVLHEYASGHFGK
jgi:predicted DNA binding CopG/RHH family protein